VSQLVLLDREELLGRELVKLPDQLALADGVVAVDRQTRAGWLLTFVPWQAAKPRQCSAQVPRANRPA
jgi:hypothetical protein